MSKTVSNLESERSTVCAIYYDEIDT